MRVASAGIVAKLSIAIQVAVALSGGLVCSFAQAQAKPATPGGLEQLKTQIQGIRQSFPGDMAVYMRAVVKYRGENTACFFLVRSYTRDIRQPVDIGASAEKEVIQ